MAGCRPCSRSRRYDQAGLAQFNIKRADSRMMANKMRYSVLKTMAPETQQCVRGPECVNTGDDNRRISARQYTILDMFKNNEMEEQLARLSLEDLECIVTQEGKDVACALTMARKNNIDLTHEPMSHINSGCLLTQVCDTDEDISADMVAKMLYAAEIKSALTAPPQVIYNLLFDDPEYQPLPVNTAAYGTPLDDVVVPIAPAADLKYNPNLADADADASDSSSMNSSTNNPLSNDVLEQSELKKILEQSEKANNLDELLLGKQSSDIASTLEDFQYLLEPQGAKHQSLFQLRGSAKPSWFPDCQAVFPDSPFGRVEEIANPMDVLERAWEHVQPAAMKPSNGVYLIGL